MGTTFHDLSRLRDNLEGKTEKPIILTSRGLLFKINKGQTFQSVDGSTKKWKKITVEQYKTLTNGKETIIRN